VLQGGTPTDPVLDSDKYAFGALRCSDDNVNGDNVEYARFSEGLQHIYCFAYYVVPPPASGTIVITKHVSDPANANQDFTFEGNVSYTDDHRFSLAVVHGADASMTFYRAAVSDPDDPATGWTVNELVPPGWRLRDVNCDPSDSTVTRDRPNAPGVSIGLVAGDTVRCTFDDAVAPPPPGQLLITKVTSGGLGTFPFTVTDAAGNAVLTTTATTVAPGHPGVAAEHTPADLNPGTYTVAETLPPAAGGSWDNKGATCNGRSVRVRHRSRRPREAQVSVIIPSNEGRVCQFTNRFIPNGRITILKTTLGAIGTTSFTVTPVNDPADQRVKAATTGIPGRAAVARGDSTRNLPLGRYLIQEHATTSSPERSWELLSVSCDGRLRAFEQGQATVELTAANPNQVCRFVNAVTAPPTPLPEPIPPAPLPEPIPAPLPEQAPLPEPVPQPDLVLDKRALSGSVRVGRIATFLITVVNRGQAAAGNVVLADRTGTNGQLVSSRPSQGTCDERVPIMSCPLGAVAAGQQITVRVRVRATAPGPLTNFAALGSRVLEATVRNNVDGAVLSATARSPRPAARCARAGPVAHAAC
jgi:uncharacterized repeat protein (TIGR01451 family)